MKHYTLWILLALFVPQVNASWVDNITVYGDWLCWKATGDGLDLFSTRLETNNDPIEPAVRDRIENRYDIDPNWDSGYRLGARTEAFCLGLFAEWSYYDTGKRTTAALTSSTNDNEILTLQSDFFGTVGTGIDEILTFDFNSRFKFRYSRIDVGIDQRLFFCETIALRPFVNFTFIQTKQHLNLDFAQTLPASTDTVSFAGYFHNKFEGFGGSVGLDLAYPICEGVALLAKSSFSTLYGPHKVENFTSKTSTQFAGFTDSSLFRKTSQTVRFLSDIFVGLKAYMTYCQKYTLFVVIGWEAQTLFEQTSWMNKGDNNFYNSYRPAANLYLQGLTLRGGLDF